MLYHVVLFSLKDGTADELAPLLEELRRLEDRVPVVRKVLAGATVAGTTYDAGLVVELDDLHALETYRAHPEHAPALDHLLRVAERLDVADLAI
jgi:hypothetical protein